jgi:hypothetical protein
VLDSFLSRVSTNAIWHGAIEMNPTFWVLLSFLVKLFFFNRLALKIWNFYYRNTLPTFTALFIDKRNISKNVAWSINNTAPS